MKQRSVYTLALTAILLWSTASTAFGLALRGMDFAQLLFIASTIAWLALLVMILIQRRSGELFRQTGRNLVRSALGGFLNPFLYYMVLLKAYSILPAQIAQPLNYTWPVVLVLLSVPFLKQKLRWVDVAGLMISFAGGMVISSQGENILRTPIREPFGVFLAASSSVIWASYWIYNIKDSRPEIIKVTLNFFFGSLFTGVYLVCTTGLPEITVSLVPAVYVGLTEMAISFVCWLTALENTKNNARISNLVFISPFIALFLIHLILGEKIFWTTPAGLLFIIGGIMVQQLFSRKQKEDG